MAKTKREQPGRRQRTRAGGAGKSPRFAGDFKEIPQRLAAIEATLKKVSRAVTPPKPRPQNRTRLLFPLVTNFAGFDTSLVIANTGQDSSGVIGKAGICTFHYFGLLPNGNPPTRTWESTGRPVAVGETVTLVLSTGGGLSLRGNPSFQGYVEVDCAFPFAHGWAFVADGPTGQARLGMTVPVLVLAAIRRNSREESAGQ